MNIYHIDTKIIKAVYDRDNFVTEDTTNNASVFIIEEVDPENKDICLDLSRTINKVDVEGDAKYTIENGELMEKENWVEHAEVLL